MRVVFMGTPEFSVPALREIARNHDVVAVYSQPPRQAGRGQNRRPSSVQLVAEEMGIEVRHPDNLRADQVFDAFCALQPDVAVVVAYGQILPARILSAPRFGCLNIHASLLPRWRGAAPIHRAVMAGDAETGVAIMQMEAGLDTGPVLAEARTNVSASDTTGDLHDRLAQTGARLIGDVLARLPLPGRVQSDVGVTYAAKIDKAEARIDWRRPATEIDRQIRGLSPFPGAWCEVDGERVKLLRCRLLDETGQPGQVLSGFRIACGDGAVEVTQVQRAGKKPMDAADFLRGRALPDRLD